MIKVKYKKTEVLAIHDCVDYLVQVSGCTREKALIALCKNGLVKGTFKSQDICDILELSYKNIDNVTRTAEFKISQLVNKVFFDEFKESLMDIDGRNYKYCATNI